MQGKRQFAYAWLDGTGQRGPMDRRRVAYLLRAARSRGRNARNAAVPIGNVGRLRGYAIGRLVIHPRTAAS